MVFAGWDPIKILVSTDETRVLWAILFLELQDLFPLEQSKHEIGEGNKGSPFPAFPIQSVRSDESKQVRYSQGCTLVNDNLVNDLV